MAHSICSQDLIKNLQDQVDALAVQNSNLNKILLDTHEENRQLEEYHRDHTNKLIAQNAAIARKNDTLRSTIHELLQQEKNNPRRADATTRQFEETHNMEEVYNSSVDETHEASAARDKNESDQVKAELEDTGLTTPDIQREPQDETHKQAYQSRVQATLNRLRSISVRLSGLQVTEEGSEHIITPDELSTEKDCKDMSEDLSDLTDTHMQTLNGNKSMKSMNDDLMKEVYSLREQQQVAKSCYDVLQTEAASLREQLCHSKAAYRLSEEKVEELQQKVYALTKLNEKIDRSLQNTTYQLRYLLRDIQIQNEILPPEIDGSDDIGSSTRVIPTEAHEKIVFHDVDELQRRNQELLDVADQRRHDLDNTIIELDQLKRSNHDLQEQLSKEKRLYDGKLDSLVRQIETLEASIQDATNERDALKREAENYARMTSPTVNLELRREIEVYKEKLVEMESEIKLERAETTEEIEFILDGVARAHELLKRGKCECNQVKARATQSAKATNRLTMHLQSAKLEVQDLTEHVQTAKTQLSDQATLIQQLEADLISEKHARSVLQDQKITIETQWEQHQQLYDSLKTEYSSMKAGEEKLRRLIQAQDAWDKSGTLDELVTSLEQQIQRQTRKFAKYKQDMEEAYLSSEYTLLEVKHEYSNLTKVLEHVKAEKADPRVDQLEKECGLYKAKAKEALEEVDKLKSIQARSEQLGKDGEKYKRESEQASARLEKFERLCAQLLEENKVLSQYANGVEQDLCNPPSSEIPPTTADVAVQVNMSKAGSPKICEAVHNLNNEFEAYKEVFNQLKIQQTSEYKNTQSQFTVLFYADRISNALFYYRY
ncbi:hypothetical protein BX666DRAFT_1944422 [Dichotomocladium elegans]|nr:hypothetical protein BX666DRAFT_1944422 [Dichotomocladium elegans]